MRKKIIALCMGILLAVGFVAVPAQKAAAADATTVFIELTGTSSEIFSTNYLRGRVLLLDANGKLATTFGGSAIADATLELQAVNSTSYAEWSTDGVNNLNPTFSYTGSEKASINLDAAYQEFAVRFFNPTTGATPENIGAETIKATLKKGTTSLSGEANITIKAPEANCFVVRTGSLPSLPKVLEEISETGNANNGATISAGTALTLHVFAAKKYTLSGGTSKYYFTNNVPTGATSVTVLGTYNKGESFSYAELFYLDGSGAVQIATVPVTLTDGYATTSVTISDLKIPDIIKLEGTDLDTASDIAGILDGFKTYWFPVCTATRKIGNQSGDVTSDDFLNVSSDLLLGLSSSLEDSATVKPAPIKTISMVGLPVNEVQADGDYKEANVFQADIAPGNIKINPLDAYYLLTNWKQKPSSFKVAAKQNSTYIYGAIVGYDAYGNPAPFNPDSTDGKVRFELKKTSSGTAINSSGAELKPANGTTWADSGSATIGAITTSANYQAFLPFMITATASSGSATIQDLYISAAKKASDYSLLSSTLTSDIDSSSEGVSFYGQQYVGAITPTSGFDTAFQAKEAGTDGEFQVMGTSNEKSFDMRGVTPSGKTVNFGAKGISSAVAAVTSITLPTDTGNLAKKDVALCTALGRSSNNKSALLVFEGTQNKTLAVQAVTLTTASMTAADPADFGISLLFAPALATGKVYLDDEGDHNTVAIASGTFLAYDGFGNKYGCLSYSGPYTCYDTSPLTLEDADLDAAVYQKGTTTAFEGASADFNSNVVETEFDLAKITDAQDEATLTISSGSMSASVNLYLQALQSLKLDDIFVPVEGVTNTPIKAYFADQSGSKIMPVTPTPCYTKKGAQLDVDLEADPADNGSITASATEYIYTVDPDTTNYDNTVRFTAKINSGYDSMAIKGESDYGDATLTLSYAADFEKPVISSTLTAIDCGFEITITDNKEVDAAATVVTVKNAGGEDITSTLTKTVASDNGTKAVIRLKGTPVGSYSVDVTAKDKAGNTQTASGLIVSVTTAEECSVTPECLDVEPAFVKYGDPATVVTITGKNTNFGAGTTVDFSCAAVTEGAVTVNSSTELTVSITVPATGTDQDCDITVTTGSETITCAGKFQVLAEAPVVCVDNDNDTYGENCAAGSDCNDNDSAVNPGAEEVCGDGIDNNCDGNIDEDCAPPCSISVSGNIRAGFILPRIFVITVTGTGTGFSTSSEVTFSDTTNIRKLAQIPSGNSIRVIGIVRPKAKGTTVTVSVAGCGSADVTVQ